MVKFGNIDDFTTDDELEMEGVDLSFGKERFITVRRAGGANKTFANHLADKFKQSESIGLGESSVDETEARAIMYNAYAKFVVIGWRGWNGSDGKPIPFTIENCIALFHESREIYDHIVKQAGNLNNFRNKEVQESGKE